jgi:hypothetical protein
LLQQLRAKAKQVPIDKSNGQPSSYAIALQAIQSGINPEQALANASVPVKNGKIMGGKTIKRRKHKKQRGGFTYKHNAKRRSFTSSLKTTSTSSNFARGKSKKSSRH